MKHRNWMWFALVLAGCGRHHDLMSAASAGDVSSIQTLILNRSDVNAKHGSLQLTPLMIAALRGRKAAVEALLAAGAEINSTDKDGYTALAYAVYGGAADSSLDGNQKTIDLLKEKGGTLSKMDRVDTFLFMVTRPMPPKCFEEINERPPCGTKK